MTPRRPRSRSALDPRRGLLGIAADQRGVFTRSDALRAGVDPASLTYHVGTGALERVGRGVYRVSHYPRSREDAAVEALKALGDEAVLSHESALALYDVSDVAPSQIHVTIPRARRYRAAPFDDLVLHTISRPLEVWEVDQHHGFRSTSLARSIVDAARTGTAPEQIVAAVRNGLRRGMLTRSNLAPAVASAPRRVKALIERGIAEAAATRSSHP